MVASCEEKSHNLCGSFSNSNDLPNWVHSMSESNVSEHKPYISDEVNIPEFTWFPIVMGALLGIVFGASSMYLVLKVGLTVSASIPVAVLSITLFRAISRVTGFRKTTILENNIVQTTGSAGESLAFAVGLIMPTLLLLGFDIDVVRVMTVSVFGGLLGILLMIPLRQAFIVKQHGILTFPEGKACAEVLLAGEKGGATATMVFFGFGLGFIYQFLMQALHLWKDAVAFALHYLDVAGKTVGLKGATVSIELSPSLLGVGYIIGPRIASIMVAGGVLAYLVLSPLIVFFGEGLDAPLAPGTTLIRDMNASAIRSNYILYIGAGAVATGGIISMLKALPTIFNAIITSLRELFAAKDKSISANRRTDRDIPLPFVVVGSLLLVLGLMAVPQLGLGFGYTGMAGAAMIVIFGFLFVTVSSRLTGEIGSSSNPISGMTVATLLLTCLMLLGLEWLGVATINKEIKLTALTIAGVVCVAAANGGSTAQALKVGHIVGATPRAQQLSILIGALTSALVVGLVLIAMNEANSTYSKKSVEPHANVVINVQGLPQDHVRSGPYSTSDSSRYYVLNVGRTERDAPLPPGRYLLNDAGKPIYFVDPGINGILTVDDDGKDVKASKFDAPKTVLMQLIIDGILDRRLPWGLVLIGALIAFTLELSCVPSLPFAVGVYLPLAASTPIFLGGMIRMAVDKWRGNKPGSDDDSSPAVLLSSGYIAGGAIAAVLISFMNFKKPWLEAINLERLAPTLDWISLIPFGILCLVLLVVGMGLRRQRAE